MSLLYLEETYEYITSQSYIYYKTFYHSARATEVTEMEITCTNDPEKQLRFEERIGGRFGNHGLLIKVA